MIDPFKCLAAFSFSQETELAHVDAQHGRGSVAHELGIFDLIGTTLSGGTIKKGAN